MDKARLKKIKKTVQKMETLVFDQLSQKQEKQLFKFNENYKKFLNKSKTERKAAIQIVKASEAQGFVNIDTLLTKKSKNINKVYKVFQGRCVALAILGKKPLLSGANIIASHIDSPRLDLKQVPFYEDLSMGLIKTHYYGGIRKYHWLAIPLALHGTIITSNNKNIEITIGEDPDDPVFTVTDLLPHLAGKIQANTKLSEAFEGEKLNLIAGSIPLGNDEEKNRFKLGLLNLLYKKYDFTEEDFVSAEIEAVPAEKARDIGFDRSMIGSYGQDDRVCAYTSLEAILNTQPPDKTAIALFFDKEEIGSEGSSGAKSNFLEDFMSDLLFISGQGTDNRSLRKSLINSSCLSADVNAAMDPDFKDVHETMNAAKLGFGICITKFTGTGGKSGSSDASAEFVGKIRQIFNKNKIVWQTGELGKIDQGGGGTVAKFLAKFGMNVLDCGPAILSMHSPFEVSSKADVYMTYLGYKAFYSDND
ncbi:MAG: aminopeptidase [Desulfobacula sp.]|jgi:aspartyl aminopeptidase|uniref:aminopeptidase n=1 Tax=Desulfobacula sp. TaxID=2593537 RepID=UPI001DE4DDC5|nr:aminopeptidase [Desulfobacula sp.]MBT3485195.1 aminopeptidase [Desulfobacula sp.]MBT3804060.1 aminopeptidase [Desulfobacula sp.]MBT4026383.1 aminopeptidase [Desulfobacula sp.]MBT4200469.1 aminopeptidase [Desulfobacula sp.]